MAHHHHHHYHHHLLRQSASPVAQRVMATAQGRTFCPPAHKFDHQLCAFPARVRLPPLRRRPRQSTSCRTKGLIRSVLAGDVDENEAGTDGTRVSARGLEKWIVRAEQKFNVLITDSVIVLLDALYADRHYARFYVLETIARVPYFAFVSVLHLYESFGWWRRADYLKVHFAESWNELHHLLVMEALGGDERWFDRFLAQHIAVAYFFVTAIMYLISPRMAYHFSECVERHAYSTYDKFIMQHGEALKKLPAPEVAIKYYTEGDLYMFDEFQTNRPPESRRPKVENLYDVFVNIREDEAEHCKTMRACQTPGSLHSPHTVHPKGKADVDDTENCTVSPAECAGILECLTASRSFAARARQSGVDIPVHHEP